MKTFSSYELTHECLMGPMPRLFPSMPSSWYRSSPTVVGIDHGTRLRKAARPTLAKPPCARMRSDLAGIGDRRRRIVGGLAVSGTYILWSVCRWLYFRSPFHGAPPNGLAPSSCKSVNATELIRSAGIRNRSAYLAASLHHIWGSGPWRSQFISRREDDTRPALKQSRQSR